MCANPYVVPKQVEGVDIKWAPMVCERRTVDCCIGLQQLGGYMPIHPHNCPLTEQEGILCRLTQSVILPTELGECVMRSTVAVILGDNAENGYTLVPRNAPLGRVEHFLANKPPKARKLYAEAHASNVLHGLSKKDANCRLFIKPDGVDPQAKIRPPPRVICYRMAKFAVAFWRVVGPLESRLYQIAGSPSTLPNVGPVFGKGKSSHARAQMIIDNLQGFNDPVVISMDVSRFDRHVSEQMHQAKFEIIREMTNPEGRRFLAKWMDAYLHPTIYTMAGTKIKGAPCNLKSGDMDTALGNNICAWIIHTAFSLFLRGLHPLQGALEAKLGKFHYLAKHEYAALIDGDDTQAIIERASLMTVRTLCTPFFNELGIPMKQESVGAIREEISWCQHKLVTCCDGEWTMVRNPRKVLSAALSGTKWNGDEAVRCARFAAIGECELCLNSGIPVLQAFAEMLIRWSGGRAAADVSAEGVGVRYKVERRDGWVSKARPITPEARVSFWMAFGWTPLQQEWVESIMREAQAPQSSHEAAFSQLSWCWESGQLPEFVVLDDSF